MLVALCCLLLIGLNGLRFIDLSISPPGFYADEAAGATQVMCYRQTGSNAWGEPIGLASRSLGGGYTTTAYLWMASAWTSLFGTEISSLRALSAALGIVATLGMFCLGRLFGGLAGGAWAALLFSLSPWVFPTMRLAWDVPMLLPLLIWATFVYLRANQSRWLLSIAGLLFALALLAYPPTKVQLALLLPLLSWYRHGFDLGRWWRHDWPLWLVFGIGVAATIGFHVQHPEALDRSRWLSLGSDLYWQRFRVPPAEKSLLGILGLFVDNLRANFSAGFLLFQGDENLRHGSGFSGIWSAFDLLGLLLLMPFFIRREWPTLRRTVVLLLLAYLSGVFPTTLTWEGNPHALRAIGAAPFLMVLAALGLSLGQRWLLDRPRFAHHQWLPLAIAVLVVTLPTVVSVRYFRDYFAAYPTRAAPFFEVWAVEAADRLRVDRDHEGFIAQAIAHRYDFIGSGYYLMHYGGLDCREARRQFQRGLESSRAESIAD